MSTSNDQRHSELDRVSKALLQSNADLEARDDHIERLNLRLASINVHGHRLPVPVQMNAADLWSCDSASSYRDAMQSVVESVESMGSASSISQHEEALNQCR